MKLFKKLKRTKKETELPSQPQRIDVETLINELAEQTPKAMEKIMALAKARREYNQKLKSLQQSIDNTAEPEEDPDPESIERTLKELQELDNNDTYTYIETTVEPPKEDKPKKKKDEHEQP